MFVIENLIYFVATVINEISYYLANAMSSKRIPTHPTHNCFSARTFRAEKSQPNKQVKIHK